MSTAPGQMLGYQLQLQRGLIHLLRAGPGSSISIEVTGDVGARLQNQLKIEEEDKSSINRNPVTNKSSDLWKTIYNWINALSDGSISLVNTKLILYTNHKGRKGIVDALSIAQTDVEIDNCVLETQKLFDSLNNKHSIYHYLAHILRNKDLFRSVIRAFELVIGSKSGNKEIKEFLFGMLLVSDHHVEFIHDSLIGWINNIVMEKIAAHEAAIISWQNYQDKFASLFQKVRARELIDFASGVEADHIAIEKQRKSYPRYLQHLKIIDIDDEEHILAVTDFLRREINAIKWIESELIDEVSAHEFEESLKAYWQNTQKKLKLTEKHLTVEERGKVLYLNCKVRQQTIGNQPALSHFIRGTFHNLANEDKVGWHELWSELLNKKE